MHIINAIQNSVWMLESRTLQSYLPVALRAISGEAIDVPEATVRSFAVRAGSDREYGIDNPPPESVAVHRIFGVITKYDYCGSPGAMTMMSQMRKADARENVIGHVIDIDSGGGEGTNIESFAHMIRNELKKPIHVHVNGMACSAAYWIASAADAVWASEPTDIFGSIGVMITLRDLREYYESKGIKLHEIYAEQSKLKNQDYHQALDGKYENIKTNLLNPYAKQFIDTVQQFRPGITADEALQGQTYMTQDAIKLGMIDGVKTLSQVIEHIFDLNNENSMKSEQLARIEQSLGYKLEMQNGGVFLNEEEITKLGDALETPATLEEQEGPGLAEIETRIDALEKSGEDTSTKLTQVEGKLTTIEQTLTAQTALLKEMGAKPGAEPSRGSAKEDPKLEGEQDALDALEAKAMKIAGVSAGMQE